MEKRLTKTQALAFGYAVIILFGTLLLMLPISSKDGQYTNFLDALFTSTSATCVTGLVIADTFSKWTLFGQLVILAEIQIGGLGFMTIGVGFAIILNHRIGLWTRGTLQESVNIDKLGGIVNLVREVINGTLFIEGIAAIILTICFLKDFSFGKALYYGIFHSISAFCNAGFDLMGCMEPYGSFMVYNGNYVICIVLMVLIIIGGIGFYVWDDLYKNRLHVKRYRLQTKMVLIVTGVLIFGGALLFFLLEKDSRAYEGLTTGQKVLAAFFNSVTARTAGFNTTDTALLRPPSQLLTIILMFIGGSPGSTAGGIKTTTIAVIILAVSSTLKRVNLNIFRRRIEDEIIRKATVVLSLNLSLIVIAVFVILINQNLPSLVVAFEVVSAVGTVGMSVGITRSLDAFSKLVIILLMYFGRVGSMTFALSFLARKKPTKIKYPVEKINVG
ncbi:MAG: TrkH family potassium uptake protein [Lachnospiraceae bacterium]